MNHLFTISVFLLVCKLSVGQVNYYTGWDDANQQSGWQQIRKGDNSLYEWSVETGTSLSAPNNIAHYYPVGGSVPTDDWYVSPGFDFSSGGSIDTIWSWFGGFGTPMTDDTIAIYLLNGSPDPDLASKTILYSYTDSLYQNDNTWRKDSNITIPPTSGTSYIAFRYETTVNWLDAKFDDLSITADAILGTKTTGNRFEFSVYPNPANSVLNLEYTGDIIISEIQIFNSSGQCVKEFTTIPPSITIDGLQDGFYFLCISTDQGLIRKQFQVKN